MKRSIARFIGVFSAGAAAIYFLLLYLIPPIHQYNRFLVQNFDFGILYQSTYFLSRFHDLFLTTRGVYAWADNQDYFQILLSLLHYLPAPHYGLLLFHSLGIYACGVFSLLYLLKYGWGVAVPVAVSVWASPFLINMDMDLFHTEAFAAVFVLLLYLAGKKGKTIPFYGFLLLALSCKEDVALTVGLLMILSFFSRNRFQLEKGHFLCGFLVAALVFFINVKIILPHYKVETCKRLDPGFSALSVDSSPASETYKNIFTNWHDPTFLKWAFVKKTVAVYVIKVIWPLFFFVRAGSLFFLLPFAGILVNILSASHHFRQGYYHYDHCTLAAVCIAVFESLRRSPHKKFVCSAVMAATLCLNLFSPQIRTPLLSVFHKNFFKFEKDPNVLFLEQLNTALPQDAVISADYFSIAYLIKGHENIYMFENPFRPSKTGFGLYDICEGFKRPPRVDLVVIRRENAIAPVFQSGLMTGFRSLSSDTDRFRIWADPAFMESPRSDGFKRFIETVKHRQESLCRPPNLLANGGFENVNGLEPAHWQREIWHTESECPVCRYEVDPFIKKEGFISIKSVHPDVNISRWIQEISAKPDTEYLLSGWIRTENVSERGLGAHLQAEGVWVSSQNKTESKSRQKDVLARSIAIYGTSAWQPVEIRFKTGKNHKKLLIFCGLGDYGAHTTGTAFFDDIQLREVPTSYLCGVFGDASFDEVP